MEREEAHPEMLFAAQARKKNASTSLLDVRLRGRGAAYLHGGLLALLLPFLFTALLVALLFAFFLFTFFLFLGHLILRWILDM
jgi:hypothetical protein